MPIDSRYMFDSRSRKLIGLRDAIRATDESNIDTDNKDVELTVDKPHTAFPTTLDDLWIGEVEFSQRSIYKSIDGIRRSTLSVSNRISSILEDCEFIKILHKQLCSHASSGISDNPDRKSDAAWPLIPNERSGSWPLDPHLKVVTQRLFLDTHGADLPVSAYFKSTDGHINQWAFSTRRLNLSVLDLLGHSTNAILIDTTRRGKTFPDALRRTVPIWCAVWNRVLFPDLNTQFDSHNLDDSEIHQIEKKVPTFVNDVLTLGLDIDAIRSRVKRPIKCLWVHAPLDRDQLTETLDDLIATVNYYREKEHDQNAEFNLLICCSASRPVKGVEGDAPGMNYIQGAGDDAEAWSHGLDARLFWQCKDELEIAMRSGEQAVIQTIQNIVEAAKTQKTMVQSTRIATTNVYIGSGLIDGMSAYNEQAIQHFVIDCQGMPSVEGRKGSVFLGLRDGKLGSKVLRDKIQSIVDALGLYLQHVTTPRILVVCNTGRDLSVGVALVILCLFCKEDGAWKIENDGGRNIDKVLIRRKLAWITTSKPDANPSRATLQAVNSFLMS